MIFVDSCIMIGYLLKRDKNHERSRFLLDDVLKNEKKLINNTVILEVVNSIMPNDQVKVSDIINCLLKMDFIYYLDVDDYIESGNIFEYYGRTIGFPDCTMIETMMKHQINTIVTFDSHFDKIKGFNIIR